MTDQNDYIIEETTDDPVEEAKMKNSMKEFLSSIYFDDVVPDWRESDTWGDVDDEYVPPKMRKYRHMREHIPATRLQEKSLSKSGSNLKFQGFDIKVETPAGGIRSGVDKDGKPWQTVMIYDYGYIKRSEGLDGDHVDVYVGPDDSAEYVYVVHQVRPETGNYDEDKCMMGFATADAAKWSYLHHYDDSRFFGAMTILPISLFKDRLGHKGEKIIPDADKKVEQARQDGMWPIKDDNLVVKYGTREGALKRWKFMRMDLEQQLEEAAMRRDARLYYNVKRKIASGDRVYKSIAELRELTKDVN